MYSDLHWLIYWLAKIFALADLFGLLRYPVGAGANCIQKHVVTGLFYENIT